MQVCIRFWFQNGDMAEKQTEVVQINDDDDDDNDLQARAPKNRHMAEKYACTLDDTMAEFNDLIREDWKEALKVTVKAFK